jgi:hypothetical protein
MLPASPIDCLELQTISWHSALQLKHLSICSLEYRSNSQKYDIYDAESLFLPSFTMCCEEKDTRGKLMLENEEMIIVLDISSVRQKYGEDTESKLISKKCEHISIERFLTKFFRNATLEICKSMVPALGQNLCMCVDLLEETDREIIFEMFAATRLEVLEISIFFAL